MTAICVECQKQTINLEYAHVQKLFNLVKKKLFCALKSLPSLVILTLHNTERKWPFMSATEFPPCVFMFFHVLD